jgi:hypothetical protein
MVAALATYIVIHIKACFVSIIHANAIVTKGEIYDFGFF